MNALPPKEPEVQRTFSFMSFVQRTAKLPKTSRSRTVDPLTDAKEKILVAIDVQTGYIQLIKEGKPVPKKGDKTASTWFSKHNDGWWASIRYGQLSIPIGPGGETDMLIGGLNDLLNFFAAVKIAITEGEMDTQIGALQAKRSEALKGKTGKGA